MNSGQIGNNFLSRQKSVTMPDSQNPDKHCSDISITRFTRSPLPAGISNGHNDDQYQQRRVSATKPKSLNYTPTHANEALEMQNITRPDSNRTPDTPEKTSEKPIEADRNNTRSSVIDFIRKNKNKIVSAATLTLVVAGIALSIAAFPIASPLLIGLGFVLMFSGAGLLISVPCILDKLENRGRSAYTQI